MILSGIILYNKSGKRQHLVKRKDHELSRVLSSSLLTTCCLLLYVETFRNNTGKEPAMNHERTINRLRGFHFAIGTIVNQGNDPLCGNCVAFSRTAQAIIDGFIEFESAHASEKRKFPEEFLFLFEDVCDKMALIEHPAEPVRQKKEGNCKLPEGVCYCKSALALLQNLKAS